MDRFTRKQEKIERQAARIIAAYPSLWTQMIEAWRQPGPENRAWLMYSANYLFRTGDVRWAMDPLRLRQRLPAAPEMPASDLKDLSFVLLTHSHGDHLDLGLLRQLRDFPILWVVPASLLPVARAEFGIPASRLIVPEPMHGIEICGICVTSFEGQHWEKQAGTKTLRGVPATGYMVEFNGKRWLFPGDTRTYLANDLPSFGPVDDLFAHIWLGRAAALQKTPPLINDFCKFCVNLQAKRVILTHLEEFGRDANDFWDDSHVRKVSSWFRQNASTIPYHAAYTGESILI